MFSDVLLTVDYDRTLTAPDSTIPERNLEAIRYFIANGGAFTINTGRSIPMTKVFRDKVPVNAPLLLMNGSVTYDLHNGRIEAVCIQRDQGKTIRRVMELLPDMTVEIQGMDAHYIFEEDPIWDAFTERNNCAWGHAQPEDDLGSFVKFTVYDKLKTSFLADLYDTTEEEIARIDRAEALLLREFGDVCAVFRAAPKILDVHAKGVSKAKSARALQEKLGRKILVCVGDGENDLPMLQAADFAFTPSDAIVAKHFPNVCPCGEGAIADVIYEKIPEILKNGLDK
jgi:HAD superfamily hydrolase (TIGR01484 family)